MLHNTNNFLSLLQSDLLLLDKSQFDFHLTGSRFFGGANGKSDWDFIAELNPSVEEFLQKSGFLLNEDVQDYLDPMTTKVMSKYFCNCVEYQDFPGDVQHTDECQKVDIQLCNDMTLKLQVRDILKKNFGGRPLPGDKYQRSCLWSMVYQLMKVG